MNPKAPFYWGLYMDAIYGAKSIASSAAPRETTQASNLFRTATGRGSIPVRITTLAFPKRRMAIVRKARINSRTSIVSSFRNAHWVGTLKQ